MAAPSVTYIYVNGTDLDAGEVNQNFTDVINGITDGTKDLTIQDLAADEINVKTNKATISSAGTMTLAGTLYASGAAEFTGAVVMSSTVAVAGATTLSSTVQVDGAATFSNVVARSVATVSNATTHVVSAGEGIVIGINNAANTNVELPTSPTSGMVLYLVSTQTPSGFMNVDGNGKEINQTAATLVVTGGATLVYGEGSAVTDEWNVVGHYSG